MTDLAYRICNKVADYILDGYVLEITGGQSSVSDLLAKEKNDAYKITVEPNDDERLAVYLKAKSGYIYYGDPSAVFSPKS